MLDRLRSSRRTTPSDQPAPVTRSFAAWGVVNADDRTTIQVCHPDWRGVRTATYAFQTPVIECSDFAPYAEDLADELADNGVSTLVVQAWPPGSAVLLAAASARGLETRVVFHSSMAQHGTDAGEAEAVSESLELADAGSVGRVGFVKEGLAEVFRSIGYDAWYVPNRVPRMAAFEPTSLDDGLNVGVFLDPYWRKNVTTQLGAVAILGGRAHVASRPEVGYLAGLEIIEHGDMKWEAFVRLQASMTLNLNVTLSECHPMSPMESYLAGVPCLVSATSALFREDPELYRMTTVTEADNPRAIAAAAEHLLSHRVDAVERARAWMSTHDDEAAIRFSAFSTGETSRPA